MADIAGEVVITLEELEALRLTALEELSQQEAGDQMSVSQSTISRHLEDVYKKIAKALVLGFAIRIANPTDFLHCDECGHTWKTPKNKTLVKHCEKCNSTKIHIHDRKNLQNHSLN